MPSDELALASYRLPKSLIKDVNRYALETDSTAQEVTKKALLEFLKNHPLKK